MAHYEKYDRYSIEHQFKHDSRENTEKKDNVDKTRSYLNYNLSDNENPIEYNKRLIEMIKEQGGRIRKDSIYMCGLIITLPKDFPDSEELEKQFFKSAKRYFDNLHGEENCLSAWVHKDEAQPHMHYRFCPIKYDEEKKKYRLCAKEILNRNFLKSFHKNLEKELEEELGFKVSVHTGITKEQGGHKEIEELKAISEKEEYINKNPSLILAQQKTILNDYWEEYKEYSNSYWSYYKTTKERIKNEIWEIKKTNGQITKQLENDLDFISNLSKGLLFALFKLFSAIIIHYRKRILENDLKAIQSKLEALDKERRSISNYQHNAKEKLKEKDLDKIENALNSWENAILKANEKIKENILNRAENENKSNLRAFREEYEQR